MEKQAASLSSGREAGAAAPGAAAPEAAAPEAAGAACEASGCAGAAPLIFFKKELISLENASISVERGTPCSTFSISLLK
ncbi:MAG: hypothetical protein ACLUAR_05300 [Pilosibacter sp.]